MALRIHLDVREIKIITFSVQSYNKLTCFVSFRHTYTYYQNYP